MDAALTAFRIFASEFASKSDADVNAVIAYTVTWIDGEIFATRLAEAIAQLTAHVFALIARDAASGAGFGGVGPVSSQKAGDLAVAFATASMSASLSHDDDYFRQTSHGLAYLQIRDSRAETGIGVLT